MADVKEYVSKMHKFNKEYKNEWYAGLAITEHGALSTLLKQKVACETEVKFEGDTEPRTIKPIYGVEIYHSLTDTTKDPKDEPIKKSKKNKEDFDLSKYPIEERQQKFHLVLLAKNEIGYKNLISIGSHAGLNSYTRFAKSFYRTDIPYLEKHGEGIIALSGCLGWYIPTLLIEYGDYEEAKKEAVRFNNIFEHFYLELQANDIPEQLLLNDKLLQISKETGIPTVITCD